MGIEPTRGSLYYPSTALKAAEPTRCPDTPGVIRPLSPCPPITARGPGDRRPRETHRSTAAVARNPNPGRESGATPASREVGSDDPQTRVARYAGHLRNGPGTHHVAEAAGWLRNNRRRTGQPAAVCSLQIRRYLKNPLRPGDSPGEGKTRPSANPSLRGRGVMVASSCPSGSRRTDRYQTRLPRRRRSCRPGSCCSRDTPPHTPPRRSSPGRTGRCRTS